MARLGLAFFSVVVGLLAIETTLGFIGFEYRPMVVEIGEGVLDARDYHTFADASFVYDRELIWRTRRGYDIFNRQGLRGPLVTAPPNAGVVRLAAVGDSNTLGWAGASGANWPAAAARSLRGLGLNAEMINAGVWGYSSFQGVGRTREVLRYFPRLLLVAFGANDAHRAATSDRAFAGRPGPWLALRRRFGSWRLMQVLTRFEHQQMSRQEELEPRVSLASYRDNLREIARLGTAAGSKVVFVTRPSDGPVLFPLWWKNFAADYNRATVEVAVELDLPVIDLYTRFKGESRYFADESHFNRAGHSLAGRWVAHDLLPVLDALPVAD